MPGWRTLQKYDPPKGREWRLKGFECPVCGRRRVFFDGTDHWSCSHCELWYATTSHNVPAALEAFAYVVYYRSADNRQAEKEAKRIWKDNRAEALAGRGLMAKDREFREGTDMMRFADWLEENDYPLNAEAIRQEITNRE